MANYILYDHSLLFSSSSGVQLWQSDVFHDIDSATLGPSCFIALEDICRHVALQQVFIDETRAWATIFVNKVLDSKST